MFTYRLVPVWVASGNLERGNRQLCNSNFALNTLTRSPKLSSGSATSLASLPGMGATVPDSADGLTISFFSAAGGGVAGGVGGAAALGFESSEPTWSCFWYFFRIPSLWYLEKD